MRPLQKHNHPPRRLKRIRKFPKHQEETVQSKIKIRGKLLRSINPKRNNRLHGTRKTNEPNGKLMHGGAGKNIPKIQIRWQKKKHQH